MRISNNQMNQNYFTQESNKTDNSNVNNNIFDLSSSDDDDNSINFSKAVRDYKSEYLTGMTEDEWDEFWARCKKYLKENPINSEADAAIFTNFMKGLLEEYGFKGDVNEMCGLFGINNDASSISEQIDVSKEMKPAKSQIITEPDGSRYLVITTSNGKTTKIKLAPESSSINIANDLINLENKSIYEENNSSNLYNDIINEDMQNDLTNQKEAKQNIKINLNISKDEKIDKKTDENINRLDNYSINNTRQAVKAYENNFLVL